MTPTIGQMVHGGDDDCAGCADAHDSVHGGAPEQQTPGWLVLVAVVVVLLLIAVAWKWWYQVEDKPAAHAAHAAHAAAAHAAAKTLPAAAGAAAH